MAVWKRQKRRDKSGISEVSSRARRRKTYVQAIATAHSVFDGQFQRRPSIENVLHHLFELVTVSDTHFSWFLSQFLAKTKIQHIFLRFLFLFRKC
jgi:hypothetical protein